MSDIKVDKKYDLFISHNGKDKPFIREYVTILKGCGYSVFFDETDIEISESNEEALKKGLTLSEILVFHATTDSIKSRWCLWELNHAIENKMKIIPIFADHPPNMSLDMIKDISGVHLKPFMSKDMSVDKIVESLMNVMNNKHKMYLDNLKKVELNIMGSTKVTINFDEFITIISDSENIISTTLDDIVSTIETLAFADKEDDFQLDIGIATSPFTKIIYTDKTGNKLTFRNVKRTESMAKMIHNVDRIIIENKNNFKNHELYRTLYSSIIPLFYMSSAKETTRKLELLKQTTRQSNRYHRDKNADVYMPKDLFI